MRFSESDVRDVGRNSQGVRSMKLDSDDYIVDMAVVEKGSEIITVSENGYGKRSDESEFPSHGRGGKGVKAGEFNDKTGLLVNLKVVKESDDLMLIADNGIAIRVKASEISKISRATQGVRIMKFKNDAKLTCVTTCPESIDEDILRKAEEYNKEQESISENELFSDNNIEGTDMTNNTEI